ncbi:MAG: BlaI/MecI/CopY family transcriptional regulator [Planctomycetes bacterium]|nr:BlaI/MecI/CopY family transcriptional regulator [Planctomycetota bacterium]
MARPISKHPTELELEILKVLWRQGPASVRQVRDALVPFRDLAYTSVMTIMTIMTEKGYVQRSKLGSGYAYRPRIQQQSTLRRMTRDLVDRAYDGSAAALMLQLIETADLDADELKRLRELIDRKEEEQS